MNEALAQRLRMCSSLSPVTALKVIKPVNDPAASLMQLADCLALDHSHLRNLIAAQICARMWSFQASGLSERRLIGRMHAGGAA